MSKNTGKAVALFLSKAEATAVQAVEVPTMVAALEHAISVCENKEYCKLLLSETPGAKPPHPDNLPRATVKTIAAPGLPDDIFAQLKKMAAKKGFELITEGMRERMAGIDVTISIARFGLGDTATCCMTTNDEDMHLAAMICESHVIILPKSKMYMNTAEAADELQAMTETDAAYTSFITGPSRTADIERVLALGVHGPLEMHVALLEA